MAVALVEDKQARDIMLLDLRQLNTIADYFVICSGDNDRQLRAIVDAVDQGVARETGRDPKIEGAPDSGWVILDYGDVVIHIFSAAQREFYRLERLWNQATPVVVLQ